MVPAPERYAVHKLIVARRRVGPGNVKRSKDVAQAEALLNRLVDVRPSELRDVWHEACERGAKWSEDLYASLANVSAPIRDRTLAMIGEVRANIPKLDLEFEDFSAERGFRADSLFIWANAGDQRIRCWLAEQHWTTTTAPTG